MGCNDDIRQRAQNIRGANSICKKEKAQCVTWEQKEFVERSWVACHWDDVIPFQTFYLLAKALLTLSLSSHEIKCREASLSRQALCVS